MKITVLALDGVFDTGLSTVLDALVTANELAVLQQLESLHFDVRLVGMRRRVRTAQGFSVPVQAVDGVTRDGAPPDWIVIPALGTKMPEPLQQALARPDVADAAAWLRDAHAAGVSCAAACIGTFVLAESGVLDGRTATTTWWLAPLFRQRYPRVALDDGHMLVASGNVLTAGAALAHIDMALWLIRQASPELAALTAKYLVVDSRPSQSAYAITNHLAHADPLVQRFEHWARHRLAKGFSLAEAADALATSTRTLQRRLDEVLGKTPLSYFQDLRVEHAVHLLKTTRLDIERIAERVGYADGVTLRALLRRRLGRGVREIRSRG